MFRIKKYSIEQIKPGMVLAKDIISARGIVMLSASTILTSQSIERIKCWGYDSLEIAEKSFADKGIEEAGASIKQDFSIKYTSIVGKVKDIFLGIKLSKQVPIDQLQEMSGQVVESLINARGVINYLHILQVVDDYIFQHSVNVAILSGLFGQWLGVSSGEIKKLVFAGLLHDIGKTQIPVNILNKPGKLSKNERDIMQRHAVLGYEVLKKSEITEPSILNAVWEHHERLDGTGYARGLKGEGISCYARIIAIADIYDAMTSDRVYCRKVTPFDVTDTLCNEMFSKLDPAMCAVIINYLRDYFVGNLVVLSDGRQGEVIYVDKSRKVRPVVLSNDGEYIDLEQKRDITIVEVFNS